MYEALVEGFHAHVTTEEHEATQFHPSPRMRKVVRAKVISHSFRKIPAQVMISGHSGTPDLDGIHVVARKNGLPIISQTLLNRGHLVLRYW